MRVCASGVCCKLLVIKPTKLSEKLSEKQRKPLVDLFISALTETNIYCFTLRDAGIKLEYQPLLEIPVVKERLDRWGNVYHHLLIACPARWMLQLSSLFMMPPHVLLNPSSYLMRTNGHSHLGLMDDTHQIPITEEQFKKLLANRGMRGEALDILPYNQAAIREPAHGSAAHTIREADELSAFMKIQTDGQVTEMTGVDLTRPSLFKHIKAFDPPEGHTVTPMTDTRHRIDGLLDELDTQWRHAYETWDRHVNPANYPGIQKKLNNPPAVSRISHSAERKLQSS